MLFLVSFVGRVGDPQPIFSYALFLKTHSSPCCFRAPFFFPVSLRNCSALGLVACHPNKILSVTPPFHSHAPPSPQDFSVPGSRTFLPRWSVSPPNFFFEVTRGPLEIIGMYLEVISATYDDRFASSRFYSPPYLIVPPRLAARFLF